MAPAGKQLVGLKYLKYGAKKLYGNAVSFQALLQIEVNHPKIQITSFNFQQHDDFYPIIKSPLHTCELLE